MRRLLLLLVPALLVASSTPSWASGGETDTGKFAGTNTPRCIEAWASIEKNDTTNLISGWGKEESFTGYSTCTSSLYQDTNSISIEYLWWGYWSSDTPNTTRYVCLGSGASGSASNAHTTGQINTIVNISTTVGVTCDDLTSHRRIFLQVHWRIASDGVHVDEGDVYSPDVTW